MDIIYQDSNRAVCKFEAEIKGKMYAMILTAHQYGEEGSIAGNSWGITSMWELASDDDFLSEEEIDELFDNDEDAFDQFELDLFSDLRNELNWPFH